MKTTDLRNTLLILAGTLLASFLLIFWWVSRQATDLRQTTARLRETKEELADAQKKLKSTQTYLSLLQENVRFLDSRIKKEPAKAPVAVLHMAKRGFNDIQHHIAKGEFDGLALTDGYSELREIFDNPGFDDMVALEQLAPLTR